MLVVKHIVKVTINIFFSKYRESVLFSGTTCTRYSLISKTKNAEDDARNISLQSTRK